MRFVGRVIDGPLQDQAIAHDSPLYYVAIQPAKLRFGVSLASAVIKRRAYRWSDALHAWTFMWGIDV